MVLKMSMIKVFFSYAPKIRGELRKIGIKENSVF